MRGQPDHAGTTTVQEQRITKAMTTQDDRAKMLDNHARIKQIPCPQCGMPAGKMCKNPGGGQMTVPHQARRHAAAEAGVYVPGGAP